MQCGHHQSTLAAQQYSHVAVGRYVLYVLVLCCVGILVNGLQKPTDLAACSTNRLLYLSDLAEGCVWQVTTGGKVDYRLPTQKTLTLPVWTPARRKAETVWPLSLSVRLGRLTVVETSMVSIYDAHDDKIDEIRFSDSVTLHHAVESDHRSYLAALTDTTSAIHSAVQEMRRDDSGKWILVREWNLRSSVTPRPLYMAWDGSGNLYVVVHDSHTVLVLDNTLTEVRSVCLHRHSVPSRLSFLAHRRKLCLLLASGLEVDLYNG